MKKFRKVSYISDGKYSYQCLACYRCWESGSDEFDVRFCKYCGVEYCLSSVELYKGHFVESGQLVCRTNEDPKWSWNADPEEYKRLQEVERIWRDGQYEKKSWEKRRKRWVLQRKLVWNYDIPVAEDAEWEYEVEVKPNHGEGMAAAAQKLLRLYRERDAGRNARIPDVYDMVCYEYRIVTEER